ncbi:MAG: LysM peptidoglycan-binding domain-containing protein [Calditerrivibrio sp.]|nr:LysM peptidoglycan-binding domain-containing protein [Calditerrivibrio sp.]
MNKKLIILPLLLLPFFLYADIKYEIKKGDTLWGISKRFYKNPFKWPVIWKYNTYILNPDLIYPKKFVLIPTLSTSKKDEPLAFELNLEAFEKIGDKSLFFDDTDVIALKENQESLKSLGLEEIKLETPKRDQKLEDIKRALKFYKDAHYDLVFESPIDSEIISISNGKFNAANDDIVYFRSSQQLKLGEKILFLEQVQQEKKFTIYTNSGEGIITKKIGNNYQAKVTKVYDAIRQGLHVVKYIQNDFPIPNRVLKTDINLEGVVLGSTNNMTVSGEGYKLIVDIGKNNGIKPGDIFEIFRYVEENGFSNRVTLGEGIVVFVQDRYANIYIMKNSQEIIKGDKVKLTMVAAQ